jgi:hypothetical protein
VYIYFLTLDFSTLGHLAQRRKISRAETGFLLFRSCGLFIKSKLFAQALVQVI